MLWRLQVYWVLLELPDQACCLLAEAPTDVLSDFDCLGDEEADAVVEDVQRFSESLLYFERTGSVASSGWSSWGKEYSLWEQHAAQLFRHDAAALRLSCPFALDALSVAQWGACFFARRSATAPYVRYLGCYRQEVTQHFCCGPQMPGHDHNSCEQACKGFPLMALVANGQCFCGEAAIMREEVYREEDAMCGGSFGLGLAWEGASAFASLFALEFRTRAEGNTDVTHNCAKLRADFGPWLHDAPFGLSRPHEVLPIFLNTRFVIPMCQTALTLRTQARVHVKHLDPNRMVPNVFDCPFHQPNFDGSGIRWDKILDWLSSQPQQSVDFRWESWVKRGELIDMFGQHEGECRFGYMVLILVDLLIAHNYWTEEADTLAFVLADMFTKFSRLFADSTHPSTAGLDDTLTVLMLTRWPVLPEFCKLATNSHVFGKKPSHFGPQRKPYALDFKADELLHALGKSDVQDLSAMPRAEHLSMLRNALFDSSSMSAAYSALLRALEFALQAESDKHCKKFVLVTILWGQRYAQYLTGFLQRSEAFGLGRRHLIFCLDDPACGGCANSHPYPALCVPGHVKGMPQKFTVVAAMLQAGFEVLLLDFDVVLMRNPVPVVLEVAHRYDAEVLVSRDFGGQCLNVGVVYFKACQGSVAFITALITWLWLHPYECDQKAFSGLLGHENLTDTARFGSPIASAPKWAVLDPINHFVTSVVYNKGVEGWSGLIEDIVIYHFLDGTGGVDASSAVLGKYVNLFDLFYSNVKLDLRNVDVPLWLQDPEIWRQLMSTRSLHPPGVLTPCRQLPTAAEFPIS